MEQQLRTVSKDSYKKAMEKSANSIQRLFNNKAKKFDGKRKSEKNVHSEILDRLRLR